jgi:Tol biopolymer transport system component
MKPDKLDFAVFIIVCICLLGLAAAAWVMDPARQPTRVAYLHPATGGTQNVWIANIDDPSAHQQLTSSEYGVFDFDFSADGRWLAFAERVEGGAVTLRLLDLAANRLTALVDCAALKANCNTPVFSPDGKWLAYQRAESIGGRYGLPRIWLVNMVSSQHDTAALIADKQVVGHSPVWSADSNTVAFYSADVMQPGILIYDFVPRGEDDVQLRFIPSAHGAMGTLAPNGQQLIFPDLTRRGEQFFTHLRIADLAQKSFAAFTDPQGPIDDVGAQWSPDGETIAFARRYTDERWTPGHQLYLRGLAAAEEDLLPIAYEPRYTTSYARWNRAGDRLVMQRFPLMRDESSAAGPALPEVWVHDLESGKSGKITEDAFLPQWVGA